MKGRLNKTEGIVLKHIAFKESSDIVYIFTEELGLIKAMAKGRRRPESRLRFPLELFNRVEIVLYMEKERELQLVKEASLIETLEGFRNSLNRLSTISKIGKVLIKYIELNVPVKELYRFFYEYWKVTGSGDEGVLETLYYSFLIRLMKFTGHAPRLLSCAKCGKKTGLSYFDIEAGGLVCDGCRDVHSLKLNGEAVRTLKKVYFTNPDYLKSDLLLDQKLKELIENYFEHYSGVSVKEEDAVDEEALNSP